MINDPIPSGQVLQVLLGVVVSANADGKGAFSFTFQNSTGKFRAIGPQDAFGTTVEVGEHWHISGQWQRDDKIGDVFSIQGAELTLPEDSTLAIWLQYNVLGMGSWYAKHLCEFFSGQLTTLLQHRDYERLLDAKAGARQLAPCLLLDACGAWRRYQVQVEGTSLLVSKILRRPTLRALSFYGSSLSESIQNDIYMLARFSDVAAVDTALAPGCPTEDDIFKRALATVDLAMSRRFRAGETLVSRRSLAKEISVYYRDVPQLSWNAIDHALSSGRLHAIGDAHVQGMGVRALVSSLDLSMRRLGWSPTLARYSSDVFDLGNFVGDDIAGNQIWVVNLRRMFPLPIKKIVNLFAPRIDSTLFVSRHAIALRAEFKHHTARFILPEEFSPDRNPSHRDTTSLVLLDIQSWSFSNLAEVLQETPSGCSLIFIGTQFDDYPSPSPWTDLLVAARSSAIPVHAESGEGTNPASLNSLYRGLETTFEQYQKDRFQPISYVDVPEEKHFNAVIGVAHQLRQHQCCIQVLTDSTQITPALNESMQIALQETTGARHGYFGSTKLCVGDPVIQLEAWSYGLPSDRIGVITEIFDPPLIVRCVDGSLKRYRVQVTCDGAVYNLLHAEAASLRLAHALPYSTTTQSPVDVVIIFSKSFKELDIVCVTRALNIASSRLIFIGTGSSSIRAVKPSKRNIHLPSAFLNALREHHHAVPL